MKKILIVLLLVFSFFNLVSCKKGSPKAKLTEVDKENLEGDYNLAKNIQDGVILHAWNWSYKTIEKNLLDIAEAGYSAVQTSPVQQPKGYNKLNDGVMSAWWRLYQPVSFSIAEESWLGTKEDLTSLCQEASKYGIKIIVDIVSNHMANIQDYTGYDADILKYESEIGNNTSKYFHPYKKGNANFGVSDSSVESQVRGSLNGVPDLATEYPYIQERVSSLLKECIDCGVDGFRFDAAKHIETPDDGDYASDFWPNVIGYANAYAKSKNQSIYYYGEVLNGPGSNRNIDSYTKYMSVTDNAHGANIYSSIGQKDPEQVLKYAKTYYNNNKPEKAVLWAESHDMYAGGKNKLSSTRIRKTWSIIANQKDATALYFARPDSNKPVMGQVGFTTFKNQEIAAVNNFHNHFIGAEEILSAQDTCFVNERYREKDNKAGVVITNLKNMTKSENIKIKVEHLKDGTYYDHVTNNKFSVKDGYLEGKMDSTGITVIYDYEVKIKDNVPFIAVKSDTTYLYPNTKATVNISAKGADKITYKFNDGEEVVIKSGTDITIDKPGKLVVTVTKGNESNTKEVIYSSAVKKDGYIYIGGVSQGIIESSEIYAWVWTPGAKDGKFVDVLINDDGCYLKTGDFTCFLLAYFEKGTEKPNGEDGWDLKPGQTEDFIDINPDIAYTA